MISEREREREIWSGFLSLKVCAIHLSVGRFLSWFVFKYSTLSYMTIHNNFSYTWRFYFLFYFF
ncbi:hypothetical protein Hanom_Chr15g01383081 [Helianthus anomalus]